MKTLLPAVSYPQAHRARRSWRIQAAIAACAALCQVTAAQAANNAEPVMVKRQQRDDRVAKLERVAPPMAEQKSQVTAAQAANNAEPVMVKLQQRDDRVAKLERVAPPMAEQKKTLMRPDWINRSPEAGHWAQTHRIAQIRETSKWVPGEIRLTPSPVEEAR